MIYKYKLLLLISLFSFQIVSSQITISIPQSELENVSEEEIIRSGVQKIVLDNGLTVYLSEDRTQKDVLGAVVVRGGAKLDPADASGTAHYFEHMMFKGSTSLGTTNYKQEKPILDSIRAQYELLRLDREDEEFRAAVLKKIDGLSVRASEYAIPNEFSKVMSSIGGTGVNAYTTYENIVYHNSFPAQSIEQWVELYVDRFQSPVFRLFQSELETVYEEKNRSEDNIFRRIIQEVYVNFYPNSVYGKKTVLGTIDDLKNPSIAAMETYFKDNYNATNMALVLIGDFDSRTVQNLLTARFGMIRSGEKAKMPSATEAPFDGRVVVKKRLSPIALGILGYRTVPIAHKDELTLDVIAKLLTNDDQTGLIDTLSVGQELLEAQVFVDKHYDKSGFFVFFAPKPIIQSVSKGEKLVLKQINKLKAGDFDDDLLSAVIVSMQKNELVNLENNRYKLSKIIDAYMTEKQLNTNEYQAKLNKITKAEIIRVANLYFGENYLSFQSKMGFPKKHILDKPKNTPLSFVNKDVQSEMAKKIATMHYSEVQPNYIDFNEDIVISDVIENLHLYYVNNPINNVFSMNIRIALGSIEDPRITQMAYYLNNTGSGKMSNTEFKRKLQQYGTSVYFYATRDFFTISIDGFDDKFEQSLKDVDYFLKNYSQDDDLAKKMVNDNKMELKMLKKDVNSKISILNEYALYGEQSQYLNRLTNKEIKALTYSDYKEISNTLMSKEVYIHYVGRSKENVVSNLVKSSLPFKGRLQKGNSPFVRHLSEYENDRFFFLDDKKALQSHIRLTSVGNKLDRNARIMMRPYNYYFGIGMNSVMFKEIREYRSLAYGAYAYYTVPYRFDSKGYFNAAMSTQADKTNESIELLDSLIYSMPKNEAQIPALRSFLLRSFNSNMPSFRTRSYTVQYWKQQGYKFDPRASAYSFYRKVDLGEIYKFHITNVGGKPKTTCIVGNSKRIDIDKIKQGKEYKKLKLKDILKY